MDFVIDLPQTLSELKETHAKLVAAGQENSSSVEYIEQLLADIEAGVARPAPER